MEFGWEFQLLQNKTYLCVYSSMQLTDFFVTIFSFLSCFVICAEKLMDSTNSFMQSKDSWMGEMREKIEEMKRQEEEVGAKEEELARKEEKLKMWEKRLLEEMKKQVRLTGSRSYSLTISVGVVLKQ